MLGAEPSGVIWAMGYVAFEVCADLEPRRLAAGPTFRRSLAIVRRHYASAFPRMLFTESKSSCSSLKYFSMVASSPAIISGKISG